MFNKVPFGVLMSKLSMGWMAHELAGSQIILKRCLLTVLSFVKNLTEFNLDFCTKPVIGFNDPTSLSQLYYFTNHEN